MLLLRLSILFAVCQAWLEIQNCGDNHKQCLKRPESCSGYTCVMGYSTMVEGDSMEVEILANLGDSYSYATAVYSLKGYPSKVEELDYRLVCHRNSTIVHTENADRTSNETTGKLEVTLLEITEDDTRHSVEALKDKKPVVYMARGIESPFDNWNWANLGQINWDDKEPKVIISERKWEKLMDRLEAVEGATTKILEAIDSLKSTRSNYPLNAQVEPRNDIKVESNMVSDKKPTSYDYNIMIQLGLPNRLSK